MAPGRGALLERDVSLELASASLERARGGHGELLAVVGEAGIGKTSLLHALCDRAEQCGVAVLRSRGAELERQISFGIAQQLFGALVRGSSASDRAELLDGPAALAGPLLSFAGEEAGPSLPVIQALYVFTANLAERGPLLLAVDDAHWADSDSVRWLAYLERRLEGLPMLLATCARPDEPGAEQSLLAGLVAEHASARVELGPLSERAVGELASTALQTEPAPAFVRACHAATGGNPFLVGELLETVRERSITPTAVNADRVAQLAPAAVSRSVLARLARLPPECAGLAQAVAVLGDEPDHRDAAALAGVDGGLVGDAADALAQAGIFERARQLNFVHPIIRASIYADTPAHRRAKAHGEAARRLAERSSDPRRVATHLLASEPSGDPWVVHALREAARLAAERGRPDSAASFLQRALNEPPLREHTSGVLYELGATELAAGDATAAIGHLRQALDGIDDLRTRVGIAFLLRQAFWACKRFDEGIRALDDAAAEARLHQSEQEFVLEATVVAASSLFLSQARAQRARSRALRERLDEPEPPAAALGAGLLTAVYANEPAAQVIQFGARALERWGEVPATAAWLLFIPANAFVFAEDFERAGRVLSGIVETSRRLGLVIQFITACTFRAMLSYRLGVLAEAEADARDALEAARLYSAAELYRPMAAGFLMDVLVDRGELEEAAAVLSKNDPGVEDPDTMHQAFFTVARARLRRTSGRVRESVDDMLRCGERLVQAGLLSPSMIEWRSEAALGLAALGDTARAQPLANEEVALARAFGAPRALGLSLRAAGVVSGKIDLLRESVSVLKASPARLEHARSLVELGAMLRRQGSSGEARGPLQDGLRGARRCGATALAERAYAELTAAGARPRRILRTGLEALTATERRIAGMAAKGLANKEIAASLFVTVRTVETHLNHAFQKLAIHSRTALRGALDLD